MELIKHYPFTVETLVGEIWAPIEGYDKYRVSNYGRVKSFCKVKEKILKPSLSRAGYLVCDLQIKDKQKPFGVHRLVAKAFIPNPENKPQVNHLDGCRWNSCLSNLEWVTASENLQHAVQTGLMKTGEEHHRSKLTNEQVVYIRENPDRLTCEALAEKFGVDRATIIYIQLGKTYRNVGGTIREKKGTQLRIQPETRNEIRRLRQEGYTGRALSEKFNVSIRHIWKIIKEASP